MLRRITSTTVIIIIGFTVTWTSNSNSETNTPCPFYNHVQRICLLGTARGGTLTLTNLNSQMRFAQVNTAAGEAGQCVADRLISQSILNLVEPLINFMDEAPSQFMWSDGPCMVLRSFDGKYALGGTELGFGIPSGPRNLTCVYSEEKDSLSAKWSRGGSDKGDWDSAYISTCFGQAVSVEPEVTEYIFEKWSWRGSSRNAYIAVLGVRDGIPSNAGVLAVTAGAICDLFVIPFTCGLAQNWTAWSEPIDGEAGFVSYGEGVCSNPIELKIPVNLSDLAANSFRSQDIVIEGRARGGIWRAFVGLGQDRGYRLNASINTRELGSQERSWEFSIDAAVVSEDAVNALTVEKTSRGKPLDALEARDVRRLCTLSSETGGTSGVWQSLDVILGGVENLSVLETTKGREAICMQLNFEGDFVPQGKVRHVSLGWCSLEAL